MRLGEHLRPEDLKQINLILLHNAAREMGGGAQLRRRIRGRVKMVSDAVLAELIDEVPAFDEAGARAAWSHCMALVTTRQPFFDANHRTALAGFGLATRNAWGYVLMLSPSDIEAMMRGSRLLVHRVYKPAQGEPRAADVASLRRADHPVRRFFAGFEPKLEAVRTARDRRPSDPD